MDKEGKRIWNDLGKNIMKIYLHLNFLLNNKNIIKKQEDEELSRCLYF